MRSRGQIQDVEWSYLDFSIKKENADSEEETVDMEDTSEGVGNEEHFDISYQEAERTETERLPMLDVTTESHDASSKMKSKVAGCVKHLTVDPMSKLEQEKVMKDVADKLHNLRYSQEANVDIDLGALQEAFANSDDGESLVKALWKCSGLRKYFSAMENSSVLEELMMISSSRGPLTEFPPNINRNLYADIVSFGIDHSEGLVAFLLNLLVKKEERVEQKDIVRLGFLYSMLAHSVSMNNNCMMKIKSLLLQSHGLTNDGLDVFSALGVAETGRSTLNTTDLLAEATDFIMRENSKTKTTQATIDNLDMGSQHMTLEYIQFELKDADSLSQVSLESSQVPELFKLSQILITDPKNKDELDHIQKIVANTVGRLLGERVPAVNILRKYLPLHYKHKNSSNKKTPADLIIVKPEGLQETVNSEMVEYLDKVQMRFLVNEVAESLEDKKAFLDDLEVIQDTETSDGVRQAAENRVKEAVLSHGVWIGHGDLLTMKMFYVAKSLRQHSITSIERLDYLEIFRLELFHLKMSKVFQDFKFCMQKEQNMDDEGTLPWFSTILGFDWASNKAQKIKRDGNFERHDQLFMEVGTQFLVNALENFLKTNPNSISAVHDELSAESFVLGFLMKTNIEFFFKQDTQAQTGTDQESESHPSVGDLPVTGREESRGAFVTSGVESDSDGNSDSDDLGTYARDMCSRLVLSLLFDRCEKEEDPLGFRGLRRVMIPYFLNRKSQVQDSKYAAFLLLDMVLEESSSPETKERMDKLVCCNISGDPGCGLCRDKVNEILVRVVKNKLRNLHMSMKDLVIDKAISSISTVTKIVKHDLSSMGFEEPGLQSSYDFIGEKAKVYMKSKMSELDPFSKSRPEVVLMDKSQGPSPFAGMTLEKLDRFVTRCRKNYKRKQAFLIKFISF